jgi:hypothetical protein
MIKSNCNFVLEIMHAEKQFPTLHTPPTSYSKDLFFSICLSPNGPVAPLQLSFLGAIRISSQFLPASISATPFPTTKSIPPLDAQVEEIACLQLFIDAEAYEKQKVREIFMASILSRTSSQIFHPQFLHQ